MVAGLVWGAQSIHLSPVTSPSLVSAVGCQAAQAGLPMGDGWSGRPGCRLSVRVVLSTRWPPTLVPVVVIQEARSGVC